MKILLLGAGGPAGVNALKALRLAGHELFAADANEAHLVWCAPWAETLHMDELRPEEINDVDADLVLAQPDPVVLWLSDHRRAIDAATFLPEIDVIERCQNKMSTSLAWYRANLRDRQPFEIVDPLPDHLHLAAEALGMPFWLRATRGAGARGAIKVATLEQAFHWIRFWESRAAGIRWVAEELLPGRDIAWSSIWYMGTLVTSFARERIEYLYPHLTPEGLTGTPTIARVIHDGAVNHAATRAILMVDPKPHGIYSVDLREDQSGLPRPTEINAGRGFTTLGLWSLHSSNFLNIAAQCGMNRGVIGAKRFDALPEGLTLSRHIDCAAEFSQARVEVAA